MSGHQFLETLHQIGYPKAQTLSARTFDWMFEDEAVLPFLAWFCGTVGHQNVLAEEDKQRYRELKESGDSILEGQVLEEALRCLSSNQDDAVSLETLRDDIERMKEDLDRHEKRKEKLVKTRNSWNLHHTGLTHRLSKLGDVETAKKHEYRKCLEDCNRCNAESSACLQRLEESVQRLCSLYSHQESLEQDSDKVFLSQLPLDDFHKTEEGYSKELTHFTKKLFFEGIADIAGGELSRYELLEVSDPTSLLVKGPSQEASHQDCQELARLQTVFPRSEGERINALVEAKCAGYVCEAADDILRKLQNGQFPSDIQEISRQIQEAKSALSVVQKELLELTQGDVRDLVKKLGALQGTQVLTGDYRLKLARQDYFTANQDQVIKYLVDQRARNEFLTMAYEIEDRNHHNTHRLLTAVQQTLQNKVDSFKARMQAMDDPALTRARYDRGTIDTRDKFSSCLHRMLVPPDEGSQQRQLFLSFSSMVQAAESLKTAHTKAKGQAAYTLNRHQDKVQDLETEVERCEDVLYSESSTVGGQPLLMPHDILQATTQLDDMLQKLEAAILDTVTDVNNKKKALKKDVLQTKERELFTYFHVQPERLKQTVENLEKRLQAHSVR